MDTQSKNNAYDIILAMKARMVDVLDEALQSGDVVPLLDGDDLTEHVRDDFINADFASMGESEKAIVLRLKEAARHFGADQGAYAEGVLEMTFKNKLGATQFMDELEEDDDVMGYEIEVYCEDLEDGKMGDDVDFDDVMFDGNYEFDVIVYLHPEIVQYAPVEVEVSDLDGDGESDQTYGDDVIVTEIRRRIKVNFRGKRRIKMQCLPGFKYNSDMKVCQKITGAEVATNRISHRRAVRTRRAQGAGYKNRVLRKTRKAKRFRAAMGLKDGR